jgi:hypothetical protein
MKPLTAALLLIVTASAAFSQSHDRAAAFQPDATEETLLTSIQNLYPRLEGTEGETALLDAAEHYLRELGLQVRRSNFSELEGGHSFSGVVEARLQGEREDTLLVVAPANHRLQTSPHHDGSVNAAALLAAARQLAESTPPISIRFLLLGAEHGPTEQYPLGSRLILQDFYPEHPVATLYLSLAGGSSPIQLDTGSGGRITPHWLTERTVGALQQSGLPFHVSLTETQVARADLEKHPGVLEPYLSQDVPAVGLAGASDRRRPEGRAGAPREEASGNDLTGGETVSRLAAVITGFVSASEGGLGTAWDSHYVFFQLADRFLFVSEQSYLAVLLGVIFATSLYGVVFRGRFDRYARTIGRNFWSLPVLYALTTGVLIGATAVIQYYLRVRGFPDLWELYPFLFFGAKVVLTLFLFSLMFLGLRRMPIAKNGSFYSASAIVLLFIGMVALATVDIAFAYYFLWAYVWTFIFSVTRNRLAKWIASIAAPLWLVSAAVDIFSLPALRAAQGLLLSPLTGNLVLALVMLPFLLMLIRLDFLVRHPVTGRRSFAVQLFTLATAAGVAVLIIYIQSIQPYGSEQPQPVRAVHYLTERDEGNRLQLESPAPLGVFSLQYGQESYRIRANSRSMEIPMPGSSLPWTITERSSTFLSRREYVIELDPVRPAYEIQAQLRSEQDLVLLEANFPFQLEPEVGRARFFIGRYPPDPLVLRFTVTAGTQAALTLEATLPGLGQEAGIGGSEHRLITTQRVQQTIPIGE